MYTLGLGSKGQECSPEDVPELHGKTALITGATTGVGLEVAKVVASKGAHVLLLARREDDPDEAIEQIRQYCTTNGEQHLDPDVEFVECDLANLEEVKRVGDEICTREDRLDIVSPLRRTSTSQGNLPLSPIQVICDAGLAIQPFALSEDGLDRHFAVSHLGHFLLLNRLLPLLRRTSARDFTSTPRIVCVSSVLHAAAPSSATFVSHAELTAESYAASSPLALYARAKLAAILFVKFGLAPRLAASRAGVASDSQPAHSDPDSRPPRGILALAIDPGPIHPGQPTQLAHAYGLITGPVARLAAAPLERPPHEAARSTLWAATALVLSEEDWARWQGAYVVAPGKEGEASAAAQDEEHGARLWAMSEDLVRKRLGEGALQSWTWNGDDDGCERVDGRIGLGERIE
ncbi:hypothetical protein C2E23DRAFT_18263 [Lenzites betulinus]|nr:hypothetical protein C2E23DRAFT_18263 [Lenzites betulinus]